MRVACHSVKRAARCAMSSTRPIATAAMAHGGDVRVVSYNLLSSGLCEPSHFVHCDPADLHPPTRLARVLKKLKPECDACAVLCLQEVSRTWAGALHTFFAARDYHFVPALYGSAFSDYMGVALAWPRGVYRPRVIDMARLADTAPAWPAPPRPLPLAQRLKNAVVDAANAARWHLGFLNRRSEIGNTEDEDAWDRARRRKNVLVFARLEKIATGRQFGIACYHMPCLFRTVSDRQTMVLHASLAARRTAELAGTGVPFVLAGDFNARPDSAVYEFLSRGALGAGTGGMAVGAAESGAETEADAEASAGAAAPVTHEEWPLNVVDRRPPLGGQNTANGDEHCGYWDPSLASPLRSAYAQHSGGEPDFTNYAMTKRDAHPFIETLDYIWLSTGVTASQIAADEGASSDGHTCDWQVLDVLDMPHRDAHMGTASFPTPTEPSDHIMIGASLRLGSA